MREGRKSPPYIVYAVFIRSKRLNGLFLFFAARQAFFSRQQTNDVAAMRDPREEIEREQKKEHRDDPNVLETVAVTKIKDDRLPAGKQGYTH